MKATGIPLAIALVLAVGGASAQSHDHDRYGPAPYGSYERRAADHRSDEASSPQGHYDWARVVRVDPVFDGRPRPVHDTRRCETRRDAYAGRDPRDGYGDDYRRDDYYRDDGYGGRDDRYRDPYGDPYRDPYREARRDENGRMVATVLGGIAGAVLGSKIGDGSGRYIGTAVGSMVGGMAGRGIYDANRRARPVDDGYVTVCGPEPYRTGGDADPYERSVDEYEVTYEYAGRQYTTRTGYHPGDRIRVRVDVRAE